MATGFPRSYRDGVTDRPEPVDPTADGADECVTASDIDRRLAAHRRWAAAAAFVGRVAAPLAIAVTVGGVGALLLRLAGRSPEPAAWAAAAGCLAACGYAVVRAARNAPTARDAAAAVDRRLRAGGLLMALADLPADRRPPAWLARLDPRRDRWADARPFPPVGRFLKALAVPAAFAALAFAVPVGTAERAGTAADRGAAGAGLTAELRGTFDALRAAGAGDPAALMEVAAQIEALGDAIDDGGPTGAQWEAADSLRDRLLAAGAEAGAAALANPDLLAGAGRAADLLGDGAGLLADGGLLDSAAAAGLPDVAGLDPAMLGELRGLTGLGAGDAAGLAAGLSGEQRAGLAAAAAGMLAGGGPGELVENLPPELLDGVFDAVGRTDPAALAKLAGVEPGDAPPPRPFSVLPSPPRSLTPPVPDAARKFGMNAVAKLPPAVAAAGGAVGTLLGGGIPGLDRLTGASRPGPPAADARRPESPAPPARRGLAAGRPVPPRLRGVVSRYFAADPAGPAGGADAATPAGVAGAGGSGQTPPAE